ncbi:MAG: DEAD/DEAH box helicase [Treponema sp.]|jgi:superfamily II DNA or RNA helicase|nr:DEAD/DEAH box helicase [Treponema sp.]
MDEAAITLLQQEIAELENLLAEKKRLLEQARAAASHYTQQPKSPAVLKGEVCPPEINNHSPPENKIALFRSLFRGREDVYAKRFESKKTGKSGYQPVCKNEWVTGVCEKPKTSCGNCARRNFEPVTDVVIRNHLTGFVPAQSGWPPPKPFAMGVYPLLQDETCHFLAIDFDKQSWHEDVKAFMESCLIAEVPVVLERSRSGNGAHVWIFFEKAVPAAKARKLGSLLMTRTLDRRPEIALDSFDRFFPNQDTLPKGGFGNLIALPLQKAAREKNHSVFLDERLTPYPDQWAFLASVRRVGAEQLDTLVRAAEGKSELLPVFYGPAAIDDYDGKPWQESARRSAGLPVISEPLPAAVEAVLADQIYVNHTGLPPVLRNRILRLASFSNPEFYRAQKMRLPTWDKPRILCCYEFFPEYIGLPVGCLGSLREIFEHYHITIELKDKQSHGKPCDFSFLGELREDQQKAAEALMAHNTGILSASTAFGKTVAALWIIAQRKVNTLILVHRKQLMDQWAERINQFLGIPQKDIGCFSGGKKKLTGVIDIAVMQSLVKKDAIEEWIKDYGHIIVDECHHISAASFERIIRKCPAYYRLGLSATLVRRDGQHPLVLMNLGDVRYSGSRCSDAALFRQQVFSCFTEFALPQSETEPAIHAVFYLLVNDKTRNTQICGDILAAHSAGRECLVLSERIEHLDLLAEMLNGKVPNLFILKGGIGKKQLAGLMADIHNVPSSKNRIILATGKYLGEGFDLPCLDTLFLVFPFSWTGTLIQYTGRLNRTYYGKKEVQVYDYVDEKVPVLSRMYKKRLKGYTSLGFTFIS